MTVPPRATVAHVLLLLLAPDHLGVREPTLLLLDQVEREGAELLDAGDGHLQRYKSAAGITYIHS